MPVAALRAEGAAMNEAEFTVPLDLWFQGQSLCHDLCLKIKFGWKQPCIHLHRVWLLPRYSRRGAAL